MGKLYIITGPPGVGKSTISKFLAEEKQKSALIEGDQIYHLVCGGYVKPWLEGNHLEVFWKNCIDISMNFLNREYDVIFNYVCKPEDIEYIRKKASNIKIKLCVLLCDEETIIRRDSMRVTGHRMNERSILLLKEFKEMNYDKKYYIDTTLLNIEEIVKEITQNDKFLLFSM